jgi:Negative regulator of beta-lactamase expression
MKKESEAIDSFCDPKFKVSSHYFIKYNGNILNLVLDLYTSWHGGKSRWGKYNSLNKYSIGIEISNPGHNYGYKRFNSKQIYFLKKLLKYLMKKYVIKSKNILGHSEIAFNRKKDLGEKFLWEEFSRNDFCFWHKLDKRLLNKSRKKQIEFYEEKNFFSNLYKIGYSRNKKKILIKGFQRKFRQDLINGKIDKECYLISKSFSKS